ncbi:hypothetical protein PMAYCL1PPCAC_20913, partial [Pristionchus mayeri]
EYDKEQYSPGETVCAKVSVVVAKAHAKLSSIKISAVGYAKIKFYCPNKRNPKYSDKYTSSHEYLSLSHFLIFAPETNQPILLPVGTHTYFYKFALPLTCDSSFSAGKYYFGANKQCEIKYFCTVEVTKPSLLEGNKTRQKVVFSRFFITTDLFFFIFCISHISSIQSKR